MFVGGDLTAHFGEAELDLRDATVADRPARINTVAVFGGVEMVVSRVWNVRLDVLPVLGGASDDLVREPSDRDEIDLVVTRFATFGGESVSS